jgi:predicted ATP-grasp superfamily ATP-dependent carboligase
MKALLAEYTVFHDPGLAPEGAAMLGVLAESFRRCGYEVVQPQSGDFDREIRRLAPVCDVGLVIAPDNLLPSFTETLEPLTHNIGCGTMSAAICANKRQSGIILARHGIAVPGEVLTGKKVIKPVYGCGSSGVRFTDLPPGKNEIGQEYIEGEHLSVSLIGSRVVGNACMYYSGDEPRVLSINRQNIEIDSEGNFRYLGGVTPVRHERSDEIVRTAVSALKILGCQGYTGVDVIVGDRVYVVDVNPRITTSITGIAACMDEEIADLLVKASRGEPVPEIHMTRTVQFDSHGKVTGL